MDRLLEETHFTEEEIRQWADDYRIHWSNHVSYYPEATDLTEKQNDLLKTHMWYQLATSW